MTWNKYVKTTRCIECGSCINMTMEETYAYCPQRAIQKILIRKKRNNDTLNNFNGSCEAEDIGKTGMPKRKTGKGNQKGFQ